MLQRSLKIVRRESGSSPKMMAVDVEAPEQSAGKLELLIGQAGGGNIIFDFNIMIPPKTAECADLRGNAEDPLEQISIVGALVQQHPASPAS